MNLLESLLASGEPPMQTQLVSIMREVLMAMQYIHAKGISHLEISHKQILLIEADQQNSAKSSHDSQAGVDSGREFKHNIKILLTSFAQAFGFRKKNIHS